MNPKTFWSRVNCPKGNLTQKRKLDQREICPKGYLTQYDPMKSDPRKIYQKKSDPKTNQPN